MNTSNDKTGLGEYDYEEHDPYTWVYDLIIFVAVASFSGLVFGFGFLVGLSY